VAILPSPYPVSLRWVLLVALAGAGCAHEDPGRVTVTELNRTIASLRAQNAAFERQVQELENRVFILGDQLESKKTAGPPPPAPASDLPKVTLHPAEHNRVAAEPPDEPSDGEVEYAGEAAKRAGKRPLLRLYGDETPVFKGREPAPEPAPARRLAVAAEGTPRDRQPRPAAAELYHRSLDSLRGGRHEEAAAGFREFLRVYPGHDYADNAQYWLGECYYDQKDYPTAVREFRRVVEKYPQGNKVPDALLKVAFCHLALGSTDVGRQTLEQLVRSYPRHEAANLANAKLGELANPKSDSHEEAP
jgi:tol-pal system protein YbgF